MLISALRCHGLHPRSQNRCLYAVPIARLVVGLTGVGHLTSLTKKAVTHLDSEFTELYVGLQIGQNEQQLE